MNAASAVVSSTRSRPASTTWQRGSDETSRPLPSFSSTITVPLSATMKLAPVMPMPASRNVERRRSREYATIGCGSSDDRRRRVGREHLGDLPARAVDRPGRGCARAARRRAGRSTRRDRSRRASGRRPRARGSARAPRRSSTCPWRRPGRHAAVRSRAPRGRRPRACSRGSRCRRARDRGLEAVEQLGRARHGIACGSPRARSTRSAQSG